MNQHREPDSVVTRRGAMDPRFLPDRFLVVSNRLPYRIEVDDEDRVTLRRGTGGLVTALDPVLRATGGLWFGWTGSYAPVPDHLRVEGRPEGSQSYELRPIRLSEEEVSGYYLGYSNQCIWPLFHYFQEHCEWDEDLWEVYRSVNRKFADRIVEEHRDGDFIWIHDYHLMLVPRMIRERIPDARIGYFLHIPFPSPEIFEIDLHTHEILDGLLGADLIGFHTVEYARNFLRAVCDLTEHRCSVEDRWIRIGSRTARAGAFPISIDCDQFREMACRPGIEDEVAEIRNAYRADILALGVDRLDYSKGIFERLQAVECMLDLHPELQGNFTFIQISAPSRIQVEAYQAMREQVEQMVGRINGRFGGKGCIPIDYRYEGLPQDELVAYYRAADVAVVTPLRDGMNLVAKEYVVCKTEDDTGGLVLSRFAGASTELSDGIVVNPYHPEQTAAGIYRAVTMSPEVKRRALQRMRTAVRRNDIYWWLERFLRELREAVRGAR